MPQINLPPLKDWQRDAYDEIMSGFGSALSYVVKSPRQRGKSYLINVLALSYALQHPGTDTLVVQPTAKQCGRLFKVLLKGILPLTAKVHETNQDITLINGSTISFRSAESREALRGYVVSGILLIDEAAYIDQDVIEILLPTVNVHRAPIVYLSSPAFAQGFFFDMYSRGMGGDAMVKSFNWSDTLRYDFSDFISKEQIDFYRKIYSRQKFQSEIIGEFVQDRSFVFGDFSACICTPVDRDPLVAAIDWASGQGGDSTVMTGMNGLGQVTDIWAVNDLSPTEQIDIIADRINKTPSLRAVLVELNSIGQIYYDMLLAKLDRKDILQGFTTSNQSKREIIEDLIAAFGLHSVGIPDDPILKDQLTYYQMEVLPSGTITYNAPSGKHDDYCISLALAYHAKKALTECTVGSFGFTKR